MAEGNAKGPDVVEGSYRVVETTRQPDGEVRLNSQPQSDTGSKQEVKQGLWSRIFGKKPPSQRIDETINKANDTMARLNAKTEIDEKIARQTTQNRIIEMKNTLGPDPRYSDEVEEQLAEMKKKRGLK